MYLKYKNYTNLTLESTINFTLESKREKSIHANALLPRYTLQSCFVKIVLFCNLFLNFITQDNI